MKRKPLLPVVLLLLLFVLTAPVHAGFVTMWFYGTGFSTSITPIPGTAVTNLTMDPQFPADYDVDKVVLIDAATGSLQFNGTTPNRVNYGSYIRGYLVAPQTGNYTFYIQSDDASELRLSTDLTPANAVRIASEPTCCQPWVEDGIRSSTNVISLVKGQKYYFEVLHKQGAGGEYVRVGWRLPDGTLERPISHFHLMDYPSTVPSGGPTLTTTAIVTEPVSTEVEEGRSATFYVDVRALQPATFQWFRIPSGGGSPAAISGANLQFLTLTNVPISRNGEQYYVTVTSPSGNAQSATATLLVLQDVTKPTVISARTFGSPNRILVTFSEGVTPATGGNVANYSLNNGATVTNATVQADGNSVLLGVSNLAFTNLYTLSISNVSDISPSANTVADGTQVVVNQAHGVITLQRYNAITGGAVADLTNNTKYINNLPDVNIPWFNGRSQADVGDNYGGRFVGYITIPESGTYRWYINSDDASEFRVGTNANPASRRRVAIQTGANRGFAASITNSLVSAIGDQTYVAGQTLFIEALWKEGTGGDYIDIGWTTPSISTPTTIGGSVFSPLNPSVPVSIVGGPTSTNAPENSRVVFSVTPAGTIAYSYQWFADGVAIPGATAQTYRTPRIDPTYNGRIYSVMVSNSFSSAISTNAVLTVTPDTTTPSLVSVGSITGAGVGVSFNDLMDPATAQNPTNYVVSGTTVTNATLLNDDTVILGIDTPVTGNFSVTVTGLRDRAGNPLAPATANGSILGSGWVNQDVGIAGDPAIAGFSESSGPGNFDIFAGGSDIWGNSDRGHFIMQPVNGNFDVKVRVSNLLMNGADAIAKADLMIRETFAADSRTMHISVNPPLSEGGRDQFEPGMRTATAGATASAGANFVPAGIPNAWLRIRRVGDTFTFFRSTNGLVWVQQGQQTQDYPDTILVGVAATAHNNGRTTQAQFRDYGTSAFAGASITITQQPMSVTVTNARFATFSAGGTVSNAPQAELQFQWQRFDSVSATFTNINNANGATYTQRALDSDNGARFRVILFVPGASVTSSEAIATVVPDTVAPVALSAVRGCIDLTTLTINFDEDLSSDLSGATFTVDNGVTVISSAVSADLRSVVLTTTAIADGGQYNATITGVRDMTGNVMANTTLPVNVQLARAQSSAANNLVVFEAENFDKNTPATATSGTPASIHTFVNSTAVAGFSGTGTMLSIPNVGAGPNETQLTQAPRLDYCVNFVTNGLHWVWIRGHGPNGNDDSIHIGINGVASTNGYDLTGFPTAGYSWFRTVRNVGGITVARIFVPTAGVHTFNIWMREDGAYLDKVLITSSSAYTPTGTGPGESARLNEPTVSITAPADGSFFPAGANITITANATDSDGSVTNVQFFSNGTLLGSSTGPAFSYTINSAAEGIYALTAVARDNVGNVSGTSSTVTIRVDSTAPQLISVGSFGGTNVGVCFSELLDPATATNVNNYVIDNGSVVVTNAVLRPDGRSVSLDVTTAVTNGFTVQVQNVLDRANNTVSSTNATGTVILGLTALDIGNPLMRGSAFSCIDDTIEVIAGGADIWATADQFTYVYREQVGDFDVKVRVSRLDPVHQNAKAGLMVRENTNASSVTISSVVSPVGLTTNGATGANNFEANYRPALSNATVAWPGPTGGRSNVNHFPNNWIRLKREGAVFSTYRSSNAVDWLEFARLTNSTLPSNVLLGLATTSHDNATNRATVAVFHNFSEVVSLSTNRPPIMVGKTPGNVVLTWDATAVGFTLQQADNLGTPVWSPVAGVPNPITAPGSVTNATTGEAMFYRLRKP